MLPNAHNRTRVPARRLRRRLAAVALCASLSAVAFPVSAAPPASVGAKWDLARWLREAEVRSPALREASEEIGVRAARTMDAAWGRFPSLRWESTVVPVPSLEGDVRLTQTPVNAFAGFSGLFQIHRLDVFLPAFTFGKLRGATRAARADEAAARMDKERAWLVLRVDVRRAYDGVKLSRELGQLLDEARKALTAADRKLEELLEAGAQEVDELDKNRFAALLADLANQRAELKKAEAASLADLQALVGLPAEHEGATVDDTPFAPRSVKASTAQELRRAVARGARKDLEAGRAGVESKRALFDAAEAGYWPDLFLSGTLGLARCNVCTDQRNPYALDFLNMNLWSMSAGVRLGLDYGVRVARAKQARATWRKAAALQAGVVRDAGQEIEAAWQRHREAVSRVEIVRKGLVGAEAWFRASSEEFLSGKGRAADYAEALSTVMRFRQDALRAAHQVSLAAGTLELAAGHEL